MPKTQKKTPNENHLEIALGKNTKLLVKHGTSGF